MSNKCLDVKEIVVRFLKDNGFDGLYNYYCGCNVNDLMPCGMVQDNCKAGYFLDKSRCKECVYLGDCDSYCVIVPNKNMPCGDFIKKS